MFCGTDNIMWDIPHIQPKHGNIPQNVINPTKHCYGSEQCYECLMILVEVEYTWCIDDSISMMLN